MEDLNALEKLDYILNCYRERRGGINDPISIYKDLTNSGKTVKADEIQMIAKKLELDGFLDFIEMNNVKHYQITYDGYLFHGYVKQDIIDKNNEQIKLNDIIVRKKNEKSLRYATWLAGIGSTGLLIWEFLKIIISHFK